MCYQGPETAFPAKGVSRRASRAVALELRILGPVHAVRAGQDVPLGGPKQRAVLALLLVDAGRAVPAGHVAEVLWRGSPPAGASKTLRSYVSRLRALLAPDVAVVARGGGYALIAGPDLVDASRFERLVGAGQGALGLDEPAVAAGRFSEALALWRGRALADVADVEPLALEAARLEELRLVAVEGRAEASIALGLHAEAAGELEQLVAEYPVRERLWRLLVLALYRGERQADALAAYRRARAMLAGELGLEPGKELRELAQAVLRQQVPAVPPRPQRHGLPVQLTTFLGREEELAALGRLLGRERLVTLTGAGGAGKTRLAVELAAGVLERFPDGAWLADLAAITDPELVPSRVMEALEVRQSGDLPVMEVLRYRLRSAELLLVLDNCEHLLDACAQLAGGLLGSSPGLRVLATSREPLGVAGEAVFAVPPLAVPAGPADEAAIALSPAVRLFVDRAAAARAGSDAIAPAAAGTVAGICRALDGLPLAIELAAARTSALSVTEIEKHLADKFRFLAYRRPVAGARHQALKAAIGWSYELLPAPERSFFRALSVFSGGFRLTAAAAVCCEGDQAAAVDLVDRLVSKSLVVAETSAAGTRYRLLETIREYAAAQLSEAGEADRTRLAHASTCLDLAEQEPDLAVLAGEHDNFRAALQWSLDRGGETGPRLASALGSFWLARGFYQEGHSWLERALAAVSSGSWLRAELLRLLGTVLYADGDLERASAILSEGAQAAEAGGLAATGARIAVLQVAIGTLVTGNTPEASAKCEAAITVLEAEDDLAGLADAWTVLGKMRFFSGSGPPGGDEEALERAIGYARRSGNGHAELEATVWLLFTFNALRIPADAALTRAEQGLTAAYGDPWKEASIRQAFAPLYAHVGRFSEARAALVSSRALYAKSGAGFDWAIAAWPAGLIEMIAGDPAAAERELTGGYQALRAMGEHAYRASIAAMLADAVYAQGRLAQAQRLADEARQVAVNGDTDAHTRWRAISAKLLARRGQFPAALELADQALALIPASSHGGPLRAELLTAKAEVLRLAGKPSDAEACLRQALDIYTECHAVSLAERTRSTLASLGTGPR
jgi:predicted ATPase/DNA-binding SARP family transcriptional activator